MPTPRFFPTRMSFRRWLARHHGSSSELWVGFWKKGSGLPSITFPEAVGEAIRFGWIDGLRRSWNANSYMSRFSPRRDGSVWSAVNTRRAEQLIRAGRMHGAGLQAFEARDPEKSRQQSYDWTRPVTLGGEREGRFRENPPAWAFFQAQPPGYRKIATYWVVSARREETRERRFRTLVEDSAAHRRIAPLRRGNA